MAVIAMTREMGSLGKDVAAGLAEQMGLTVVHHELVEHHLAEKLGVQESTVHRYLEGEASLLERWKIDKQKLSRFTADSLWQRIQLVVRGKIGNPTFEARQHNFIHLPPSGNGDQLVDQEMT